MIPRYTTPEMAHVWSDEARMDAWIRVEIAATRAQEKLGRVPGGTTSAVEEKAAGIDRKALAARALEIEETTRHDVIAFLSAFEEQVGDASRWVHFGMTSSDVVDTAFALLLVQAGEQVVARAGEAVDALVQKAEEHKKTVCLGRTHGQAAEPTSFGLKLIALAAELDRGRRRVAASLKDVAHGKLSGAVGNFGNIGPEVEAQVMAELRLSPEPVSTQVVPRDRHSSFFCAIAILGGAIERFSVEVRHLMRSEVQEAFEPFGKGQRGSSAMPHKKNPILTENLTGQARLLRSYAGAALENQALWHERDISHSSVERMIGPDATATADFALKRLANVAGGLVVDAEAMRRHMDETRGLVFSEAVLLALVAKGILRQEAYGWVQRCAMKSREQGTTFADELKQDEDILAQLKPEEIDEVMDPEHHLRFVDAIFERTRASIDAPLPPHRPS
jgi:adenylosuccinate lyase